MRSRSPLFGEENGLSYLWRRDPPFHLNILLATCNSPWPADSGGAQRTLLLLEALRELGRVDLLLCPLASDWTFDQELCGRECATRNCRLVGRAPLGRRKRRPPRPRSPFLAGRIAGGLRLLRNQRGVFRRDSQAHARLNALCSENHYDLIVCHYLATALTLGVDNLAWTAIRVVDVDDVPWRVVTSELVVRSNRTISNRALDMLRYLTLRQAASRGIKVFDHLWVAKESDLDIAPARGVSLLPNIPLNAPAGEIPSNGSSGPRILIVGSFGYRPNREGALWFLRFVWPQIQTVVENCELVIVGNGSESLAGAVDFDRFPGVVVRGRVEDVTAEYQAATVAVAPILFGGGTKIKVLEALANGRPCVATVHAAEGFERLRATGCLLVTDDPTAFARHCIFLLERPRKAHELGWHGRSIVNEYWTKEVFFEAVAHPLRRLLGVD